MCLCFRWNILVDSGQLSRQRTPCNPFQYPKLECQVAVILTVNSLYPERDGIVNAKTLLGYTFL